MRRASVIVTISLGVIIIVTAVAAGRHWTGRPTQPATGGQPAVSSRVSPTILRTFRDDFSGTASLQESGSPAESASPDWWLDSGGLFLRHDGYAQTVEGALPNGSRWRGEYAKSNPRDTDTGEHPQNIFRLVTKSRFRQLQQETYFRIDADELSKSPQRAASNGLLLFNRYQDGDNLYYTGLRVDGHAVIKKKQSPAKGVAGVYSTMAEKPVFPGSYDRNSAPNLLPKHTWIGIRSVVITKPGGSVEVQLWSDLGHEGQWQMLLTATDDGRNFGGPAITGSGYGGLRTDFMDVSFKRFSLQEIMP
jgi:hypothetical protein